MRTPRVDVSVVVGTLNRSAGLEQALRSLVAHPHPAIAWEVIVCDNGSTDDTRTVVERVSRTSAVPVRYILEPRRGVSHARNAAIAASCAPIVAFTDDDQDVGETWLPAIVTAFQQHPDVDVIGGRVLPSWLNAPPAWVVAPMWGPVSVIDRGLVGFRVSRHRWMCLPGGNAAWRRSVLVALGGFSPHYPRSQDRELLVRALLAGCVGLYVPEMVVYHRVDGGRLSKPAVRRWNRMEGRMRAGFAFEEIFTREGHLRPIPDDVPRVLGVSRFLYRSWLAALRSYAAASLRGRREEAFRYEGRLLYLSSYIHRRIELTAAGTVSMTHRTGALVANAVARAAALFLGALS